MLDHLIECGAKGSFLRILAVIDIKITIAVIVTVISIVVTSLSIVSINVSIILITTLSLACPLSCLLIIGPLLCCFQVCGLVSSPRKCK